MKKQNKNMKQNEITRNYRVVIPANDEQRNSILEMVKNDVPLCEVAEYVMSNNITSYASDITSLYGNDDDEGYIECLEMLLNDNGIDINDCILFRLS